MTERASLIANLKRTHDATQPFFRLAPAVVMRSYAPGKWSMHQLLLHLADHESVVLDRLRRTAADPTLGVALPGYDQDAWANGLDYGRRSLVIAEQLYSASRLSIIELIEILPSAMESRFGMHSERGRMTLLQQGDTWGHNDHHLAQIQAIASGKTWKSGAS
jgi:hypothetical protein